jgi:uncharacterized damage-inducible protein DinB
MKADLARYLVRGREALLWKLDGLSEFDARRPLTPTGTNVLGLVKHCALMEAGYFGEVFDRPFPRELPWLDGEPNLDLWAQPGESREFVLDLHAEAAAHADATIAALDLDAPGHVPWWPEPQVTLARIIAHMIAERHRHAGQADIVRESIDGLAGLADGNSNLPEIDWSAYRARLQAEAERHLP